MVRGVDILVCVGELKIEGRSLMDELRGVALNFHKPGEMERHFIHDQFKYSSL